MGRERSISRIPNRKKHTDRTQYHRVRSACATKNLEHRHKQSQDSRHTSHVKIAKSNTGKWPFAKVVG